MWIIDNSTVSPRWPAIKDHTKQLILDNIMVVLQGSGLYFDPRASLESLRSCVIVKMYGGSRQLGCVPVTEYAWAAESCAGCLDVWGGA